MINFTIFILQQYRTLLWFLMFLSHKLFLQVNYQYEGLFFTEKIHMTTASYFPFTSQQYYGTLWPSSQFKLICWMFLVSTNLHRWRRKCNPIQSNPWAAHPNIFTSVSFKFTGIILWQSTATFHEKLHFSQIFDNALSLIPVTVCIACNKLNAQMYQRNNCCPLIRALHHHDQEDMITPHHTMRGPQAHGSHPQTPCWVSESVFPCSCGFADRGAMIRMSSSRTTMFKTSFFTAEM